MRYVYLISYHRINISHMKGMKNKGWIIYPTTFPIPYLVKHRIGYGISYPMLYPTNQS